VVSFACLSARCVPVGSCGDAASCKFALH